MKHPLGLVQILVVGALLGCSGKRAADGGAKEDAATASQVPPIAAPVLGVTSLPPWGFMFNDGKKDYEAAVAAYKAKPRDWAEIRARCEAAIAKDAEHYDAHRLLGTALVRTGAPAAAVDQLVIALAADYFKYGPSLADDADLADFLATPHGAAVTQLAANVRAEYAKRIAGGVLLVGRRSAFKWPTNAGVQPGSSRGELYAFDRETRRYLRISHTDHQVVGFVRNSAGTELALLGFDRLERPTEPDVPPLIGRAWVQTLDTKDWKPPGKRTTIAGPAREVALGYAAGDVLVVSTAPAQGRWGLGPPVVQAVDSAGKLSPAAVPLPPTAVVFSLDDSALAREPAGVVATWTGTPPTTATLQLGGATIRIPESGAAAQASVAVAPDSARLAFATAVDPCAKDTAPSLYVADAKGALQHVLTARSRFATRWIDATSLAYEDGEGAIRIWDATANREALKITNAAGIALDVLARAPAPLCKQLPVVDAGAGSGSGVDDSMPPEESGTP